MKVKVLVAYEIDVQSNNPVLEELADFHLTNRWGNAGDKKYAEAEKEIENLTGIPAFDINSDNEDKHFYAVYRADDDAVILEY